MKNTYRVVVIGSSSLSIVGSLTSELAQEQCDLVATSSFCLGDNFVIMMIVKTDNSATELRELLGPVSEQYSLQLIVDVLEDFNYKHESPDVSVLVHGADRIGVFSYCMAILNDAGLEVLSMHSDLLGKAALGQEEEFLNIIKGRATLGIEELNRAADNLRNNAIDVTITLVEPDSQ